MRQFQDIFPHLLSRKCQSRTQLEQLTWKPKIAKFNLSPFLKWSFKLFTTVQHKKL